MIGSPSTRSTTAPGKTQSGSPSRFRSTKTAASTATDASAKSSVTRTGCARRSAASAPEVIAGAAPVGSIPPLGVAIAWNCVSSSCALCTRSAGFFSRQRITSALSAGGTDVRCALSGAGACVTCAASTCCGDIPLKGGRPQSISYAIAPRA